MSAWRSTKLSLVISAATLLFGAGCATMADTSDGGEDGAIGVSIERVVSTRWKEIARYGKQLGFTVTSTTGGVHNPGSRHAEGRAVDFSVHRKSSAEVEAFMRAMRARGYVVRDERTRPPGQPVWSGPHIHVEDTQP